MAVRFGNRIDLNISWWAEILSSGEDATLACLTEPPSIANKPYVQATSSSQCEQVFADVSFESLVIECYFGNGTLLFSLQGIA